MAELKLDIRKSLEKNAATYFESAKKLKAKIEGINTTIEKFENQLYNIESQEKIAIEEQKKKAQKKLVEKKWFEKFHWFISSEGFLCIGGRDATTNEVIIKKHVEKTDLVFHTESAGSPFFVIKSENKTPGAITIEECAGATVSYSRAWKLGLASADVYWILPEQISKQTPSGEFVPKGAFIIRGKKNIVPAQMKLAVGLADDGKIMGGPPCAIAKHCKKFVFVVQGDDKTSDAAKKILKILGGCDLNEVVAVLPAGGCRVSNSKI